MGPRRVICGYCGLRLYYGGIHWLWRLWGVMRDGRWFAGIGINREIEIELPLKETHGHQATGSTN